MAASCHLGGVKPWIAVLVALAASAAPAAAAPARQRCEVGARFVAQGDLPRAALYLDGCDEVDGFERASRELKKKLEASALSKLEIVTTPAGLTAEIDALPGERFTTPATLWVNAGHYVVRAGDALPSVVDVKPHSHAMVVLDAPKAIPLARDGQVDMADDTASDVTKSDTLPDVQHRPMLDCKYRASCPASGAHIDDPLELHADAAPPHPPALELGMRAGAGTFAGGGVGPTLALDVAGQAPWEDTTGAKLPFLIELRADYGRRRGGNAIGATIELAKVIAAPDTAWLSFGLGARLGAGYHETINAMTVDSNESAGVASLDLALRRLPIVVGARYEQGVATLADGSREHAVILEVGFGLRKYRYGL
jgi:hypothetical protein